MKKVLFAVFFTIILCAANLFAQEIETWSVAFDDSAAYEAGRSLAFAPKKIIYIMLYIGMFISALLALLKKISLYWNLALLGWTATLISFEMIEDFVDKKETLLSVLSLEFLYFTVFVMIALLPIFIPLLQYKFKKIDKKQLKHRLLVWGVCGLSLGLCIGIFYFI